MIRRLLTLIAIASQTGLAQTQPRLSVRVEGSGVVLENATVRVGSVVARTNATGIGRLTLPAGDHMVHVTMLGYHPDSVRVLLAAGRDTLISIELKELPTELEQTFVVSTRGVKRVENEPTRVEVLGGDDVAEKTEMRPQDLRGFLTEMAGVRLQQTSAATGASGIRLQGLRPRYTLLLADGLPSYGGSAGNGLDLMQMPPADLRQIEVVKGPASALYGASALGGTINLVSKRPADEYDLLMHGTSERGANAFGWVSKRQSEAFGYTAVAGAHTQQLRDGDGDGWAELPEVRRVEARPRLFFDLANGGSVFATAGATLENRTGGTISPSVYRETANTRRADGGILVNRLAGKSLLQLRSSANVDKKERNFGGSPENVRRSTVFAELSASRAVDKHGLLGGAAIESDAARITEAPALDYTFTTASLFAQDAWEATEKLAFTASARFDSHSRYGAQLSPRVSALYKLAEEWGLRLSATRGWYAPTPFMEETEETGVRDYQGFDKLSAEVAEYGAADLNGKVGPLELNATLFTSRISHPAFALETGITKVTIVIGPGGGGGGGTPTTTYVPAYSNAPTPTRSSGLELFGVYDLEPLFITALYTYSDVRETGGPAIYTPKHAGGVDITWEDMDRGLWIALESFYTGTQRVDVLGESKPYLVTGLLATQRFGRYKVFANIENLGDVRQTKWAPVLRSTPSTGGAPTYRVWAPLEGRTFSVGLRIGSEH